MKAIVNTAPGTLELQEVPRPEPGPGQVRIRTVACGICATDFEMIDGASRGRFPQVLGHEWSGVVDACGTGAPADLLGRNCVAENVVTDGGEVGFEHSGGYGEFFVTEARNVHVLPDDFPMDSAALIEPLAVTVRAMDRLRPEKGSAVVLGDGAIGLMMLMLLRHAGVSDVVLVGGRKARLALAEQLGASLTIDYHAVSGSIGDELHRRGQGRFSTIVDAVQSGESLAIASQLGAHGAKVLLLGYYGELELKILPQEILMKEFQIIGSNASAGAWPDAVRLAVGGALPLGKLATHRFSTERFEDAMRAARKDKGAIKVMLCWDPRLA